MYQADFSHAVTLWDMIESSASVWGVREWLVHTAHSWVLPFDLQYFPTMSQIDWSLKQTKPSSEMGYKEK